MDNPRLTPEQQDVNLIGTRLLIHQKEWLVTDSGIKDVWGITCVSTRAFSSMTTEEIYKYKM